MLRIRRGMRNHLAKPAPPSQHQIDCTSEPSEAIRRFERHGLSQSTTSLAEYCDPKSTHAAIKHLDLKDLDHELILNPMKFS
jgi:hypothetical protein